MSSHGIDAITARDTETIKGKRDLEISLRVAPAPNNPPACDSTTERS
jgi:hypothetical protein